MSDIPLPPNAEPSICLTDAGIAIDFSDGQPEKTSDSIRQRFASDSKITSPRESQSEKHSEQRILTHFGIEIDDRDEQPAKTPDSIR
jgi:hypothetical protein